MTTVTKKQKLRETFLLPKQKLREERRKKEFTTSYVGNLIGLERRQYEMKESGKYPFHDYEMNILAEQFGKSVTELFF